MLLFFIYIFEIFPRNKGVNLYCTKLIMIVSPRFSFFGHIKLLESCEKRQIKIKIWEARKYKVVQFKKKMTPLLNQSQILTAKISVEFLVLLWMSHLFASCMVRLSKHRERKYYYYLHAVNGRADCIPCCFELFLICAIYWQNLASRIVSLEAE